MGLYEGHAFLIRDIKAVAQNYTCGDCQARFTQSCHLVRHASSCSGGQTKINCPNKRIRAHASAYERAFYPDNRCSFIGTKWLEWEAKQRGIHIHHARCGHGGERYIFNFPVDGYHPETNTVFQYYGCYWHGCKQCHKKPAERTEVIRRTDKQGKAQKARDLSLHHGLNVNLDVPSSLHVSTNVSPELFVLHQVTENQVEKVIRRLPSNKAPGIDKISSRILKYSLPSTLTTITRIVNNSFVTNTFARAWKTAEVTPILKCGNPDVPNNYRPISLFPIVSKITERLVHGQLMKHLIRNNKLAAHQSGNRKLHSTETALLYVMDQLLQAMDSKKVSIMVLLDMSKAFDSIRHDILLSKLQNLDFFQGALDWFQSYLSNRQQCGRIGDAVSKVLPLEFGVPQGSILGPVLFTIYVNDLLSVPKRCLSASYVDDCKLYLSFSPAELRTSILALNEDLTRISQWCCKNSLLINPDKTKVLTIGVPQLLKKLSSFSITLFDKEITPVPVVKDLGVFLDTCLSYNEHITETASKCLFKLYQINRIKHLLDRKTLLLVINYFVFNKLQYCSTVWSNTSSSNIDKLQKVQNFA